MVARGSGDRALESPIRIRQVRFPCSIPDRTLRGSLSRCNGATMTRPRSQRRQAVAGARSLKLGAEDKLNAHGFSPDAERYRTLFEGSHVGMAFVAPDGTVLEVNPAACELWGRSAEELVGMPGTELPHPDDLAGARAGMARVTEGAS